MSECEYAPPQMVPMQNIDPLYFLQPILSIALPLGLVIYWHYERTFTRRVLFYSFIAYAGAIGIKVIFQYATYASFRVRFGENPLALGTYFGLQTIVFEVGLAFLIAMWAISRRKLHPRDAEGYGLGLAFWENAGLVGGLGLVNLTIIYLALASGGSTAAPFLGLANSRPDLFYPPSQALPLIAWGTLERVTSLLFHVCWGYLTLLAAAQHRMRYLFLALPMGGVDLLVPFAGIVGIEACELSLFVLGLGVLGLTVLVTKGKTKKRVRGRLARRVVR